MAYGVGASGFVGIAPETTPGTYVAPTFFLSLRGETLKYIQQTFWRRVMRGTADIAGGIQGDSRVEGTLDVELIEDGFVHLLRYARGSIVKTGAAAPYTYAFTPSSAVQPTTTCSITVVRNGVSFGYVGCVISSMNITVNSGILVGTFSILGTDEASQAVPVSTFSTLQPYGQGQYSIQIPTATQVFDVQTFTFSANDNAQPQYRLRSPSRGAVFTKYGERSVDLTTSRDFQTRAEYDAFKALTAQTITITATKTANQSISIVIPNAIKDNYEITGLTGQANLIMANMKYIGTAGSGSNAYTITVTSDQTIPIP